MPKPIKTNLINDKAINTLKKFMIFDDLSLHDIKTILDMDSESNTEYSYQSRIAKLCQYSAGEIVIREGDFDSWSFWVVKGKFDVIQNGEIIAVFSKSGQIFGEMSVLEGIPRTATVVSKEDGVCLCLDMSVIENLNDKKIKNVIRNGFYRVILDRIGKTKSQMREEKEKFEKKYAKLIGFEKDIAQKTSK